MTAFVLIHGAYQGGWIWGPVARRLRAEGHDAYAPSLDGCGERSEQDRPGITVESQAAEIAELLFYEDLSDVVLVGTSSGGMVAARTAELARERIARLVFVDALVLKHGETSADVLGRPRTAPTATGRPTEEHLARLLGGLPPETAAWAGERFRGRPGGNRHAAGRAGFVLGPGLGCLGDLVPACAESRRGAPAPHRGGIRRALARARHRPLPDAQRAGGADAADPRGDRCVTPRTGAIRSPPAPSPRGRGRG